MTMTRLPVPLPLLVAAGWLALVTGCAEAPAPAPTPTAAPPAPVCTPGQDQTCNDNPAMSSLHGTCRGDAATCDCHDGFAKNPATGRCR
jgi:hypothetical protein